ncbi:MAG TPA: efflux RND transporter periplasmic adaptor subunit [Polyangiaceae bacterium]|nr:efflux RND transporter periplasmic adaptor subunit [Polyangiaceae bacterium]
MITESARALPMNRKRVVLGGTGGLAVLALLFLVGYLPKRQQQALLATEALKLKQAVPRVVLIAPRSGKGERPLSFSATLEGLEQTEIDARANGYVRRWLVDLGDSVKEGQLLAELDTPELDLEIDQARAALAQSEASISQTSATRDFSLAALKRYEELAPQGLASQQDLEQKQLQAKVEGAGVRVAEAARNMQLANLHRLEQLKAFARVTAPFAGTITERAVQRGKLVAAGTGQHLFKVASLDPLRAFVQVPQSLVSGVKQGLPADVSVAEKRGKVYKGVVARTASALDAASRTMSIEVQVANPEHRLLPGMYVDVLLKLEASQPLLVLPASAIATTKEGVRVAVVDSSGRVRWTKVRLERDNGAEVEISEGLSGTEQIIASPGPSIVDGSVVQALK